MKNKLFLIVFTFFVLINSNTNALYYEQKEEDNIVILKNEIKDEILNNKTKTLKQENEDEEDNENDKNDNIEIENIVDNKKVLKKQIQNRKKLHKNLLSIYNENFDNKYLEQITNNWLILNQLNNYYENLKEKS